jgi:O-antigen/teichoic acid export membrane protein
VFRYFLGKSFLNISFVGAGNIVNTILGFVFLAALTRSLSLEDFGKYALLASLLIFTAKITDFGTGSLFVAKAITKSDRHVFDTFASVRIMLFGIAAVILLAALHALNLFELPLVLISLFGLFAYLINFATYSLFQRVQNYLMLILLNAVMAVIKFVFAILILTSVYTPTLVSAFAIFSLSVFPSLLLCFFLPKEFKKFSVSFKKVGSFIKETFPGGFSQMVAEGWSALGNSIAKVTQGFSNVGIFSLADKISSIFSLIAASVFTVLLPKNAQRKSQRRKYDFKEAGIISIVILLLAGAGTVVARILVPPIFGENFVESLAIIDVLLFANALNAIYTFMENYFFVEGKTKYLLWFPSSKLILILTFSFLLVPRYGLSGLAWAQLITAAGTLLFAALTIKKIHREPLSF